MTRLFTATVADYADMLRRFAPRGKMWTKLSTGLTALYRGLAQPFVTMHNRAIDLITKEAHPGTAVETLNTWLAEYGLPEPGTVLPPTDAERRLLLVSKINTVRGQSPARMIAIAAGNGVTATVDERFDAARPYTWRLVMGTDCIVARYGTAVYEDPFTGFTAAGAAVVSQIQRAKPAYTIVEYWDV